METKREVSRSVTIRIRKDDYLVIYDDILPSGFIKKQLVIFRKGEERKVVDFVMKYLKVGE